MHALSQLISGKQAWYWAHFEKEGLQFTKFGKHFEILVLNE